MQSVDITEIRELLAFEGSKGNRVENWQKAIKERWGVGLEYKEPKDDYVIQRVEAIAQDLIDRYNLYHYDLGPSSYLVGVSSVQYAGFSGMQVASVKLDNK
ncbi:MAG: hypothetical protein ABII02_02150 [Candidatus Magasanikbacteria bacterium]